MLVNVSTPDCKALISDYKTRSGTIGHMWLEYINELSNHSWFSFDCSHQFKTLKIVKHFEKKVFFGIEPKTKWAGSFRILCTERNLYCSILRLCSHYCENWCEDRRAVGFNQNRINRLNCNQQFSFLGSLVSEVNRQPSALFDRCNLVSSPIQSVGTHQLCTICYFLSCCGSSISSINCIVGTLDLSTPELNLKSNMGRFKVTISP